MKAATLLTVTLLCIYPAHSQIKKQENSPVKNQEKILRFEGGLSAGIVITNKWIADFKPDWGYTVSGRFMNNTSEHFQSGLSIDIQSIRGDHNRFDSATLTVVEDDAKFASPLIALNM